MDSVRYLNRTAFVLGRGAESDCGVMVRQEGARSVLVIYGRKYAPQSGLLERLSRSLDRAGIAHYELGGVVSNPRVDLVREGIALCGEHRIDFILAVGGGSVIDSAKAIAAGMFTEGDVWDLYRGTKSLYRALPVGVILTFPGSGSECSDLSYITNDDEDGQRVKRALRSPSLIPRFCIMNPELTYSLSAMATANGAVAMLAHLMSCYFTAQDHVPIVARMIESQIAGIIDALRRCQGDLHDYDARFALMWAEMMVFAGPLTAGIARDHATALLENAISEYRDKPHGNTYSLLVPAYLCFITEHDVMKMARFASYALGVPLRFDEVKRTAKEGISRWYQLMEDFSLPCYLSDIHLSPADIPGLIPHLPLAKGHIGSYVELDRPACEAIYTLAVFNPLRLR